MKNIFKKSREIGPDFTFVEWVFKQNRGWSWKLLTHISDNPLLMIIVNLCLWFDWRSNKGKFKSGDLVKYNLFARVVLGSLGELKSKRTYVFVNYCGWSSDKGNCDLTYVNDDGEDDTDSCSVFWLRKLYLWE